MEGLPGDDDGAAAGSAVLWCTGGLRGGKAAIPETSAGVFVVAVAWGGEGCSGGM